MVRGRPRCAQKTSSRVYVILTGLLRRARGDAGNDFDWDHFTLPAEATADQRLDHPNLRHRHLEHQRQLVLQVIGNLRGGPDRQAAECAGVRIEFERSQRTVRFHGRMGDLVGEEAAFGDVVGVSKRLVGIAEDVVIILLRVVRLVVVDEIGLGLHRFFGVEVGGQKLIIHSNQFERLLGNGFGDRSHAGYVVTDVANLVERQRVLVVADGENAEGIGRVLAGDHRDHTVKSLGSAGVNALDASMRMRRMQNLSMEHAGDGKVVGVLAAAGRFSGSVNHGDGFADDGVVVGHWSLRISSRDCHFAAAIPFFSASIAALIALYICV